MLGTTAKTEPEIPQLHVPKPSPVVPESRWKQTALSVLQWCFSVKPVPIINYPRTGEAVLSIRGKGESSIIDMLWVSKTAVELPKAVSFISLSHFSCECYPSAWWYTPACPVLLPVVHILANSLSLVHLSLLGTIYWLDLEFQLWWVNTSCSEVMDFWRNTEHDLCLQQFRLGHRNSILFCHLLCAYEDLVQRHYQVIVKVLSTSKFDCSQELHMESTGFFWF